MIFQRELSLHSCFYNSLCRSHLSEEEGPQPEFPSAAEPVSPPAAEPSVPSAAEPSVPAAQVPSPVEHSPAVVANGSYLTNLAPVVETAVSKLEKSTSSPLTVAAAFQASFVLAI